MAKQFKGGTKQQTLFSIGSHYPDDGKATTWAKSVIENPELMSLAY